MAKYYHVTPSKNVTNILKEGLIPKIGNYSKEMGENIKAVWLFPDIDDAEEMTPIWLESFYEEELTILEIDLPDDIPVECSGSDYEVYVTRTINPKYIKIYDEE